jgi:membrane fusion protein, multidrug efflux system
MNPKLEKLTAQLKPYLAKWSNLSGRHRMFALGTLVVLLFCLSGILLASLRRAPQDDFMKEGHVVKIGEAKAVGAERSNSYPGTVKAFTKVNLFFRVGGPIVDVSFQVGDKVRKGQALMRIDPRDFERRVETLRHQVAQEEAKFAAMKNGDRPEDREIAKKELASATARFDKYKFDFERAERLYKSDVFSKAQYDEARSSFLVAESAFAAYKQKLAKSTIGSRKEDIDAEAANLDALKTQLKIAGDALSDTVLSAPFDGIITKRLLENHEMAQAYTPVLTMQDIQLVKIDVDVPETSLSSLDSLRGKPFTVSFSSNSGGRYKASLEEFSADANAATRTYTLTMHMRQPADFAVLPGMTAEVSGQFQCGASDGKGALVPSSAIVRKPGSDRDSVWLLSSDGRNVSRRAVKVSGIAGADATLVEEGLAPGERIVVAGGNFLEDGMTVRQLDFHKGVDVR